MEASPQSPTLAAACDVCGRSLLRGEHAEVVFEGSEPRTVCELCLAAALSFGWTREAAINSRRARSRRRGGVFARLKGQAAGAESESAETPSEPGPVALEPESDVEPESRRSSRRERQAAGAVPERQQSRRSHAVPLDEAQQHRRAVELFNQSTHTRDIAGITRTLGEPVVSVRAEPGETGIVSIVVAWDLSWYRYGIDLASGSREVALVARGDDPAEIDGELREPNAISVAGGALALDQAEQLE